MGKFVWSEEYSVSVNKFDEHHKKLIGYINELHEAMQVGQGKETLGKIMDGLIVYTQNHFKAEEELMLKFNYPGYLAHQKEHERLTTTALDLQEKFSKGQVALSITTINFLKDWLTNHILVTDKKYGPFFNRLGEK
jgi:hemerythrin